MGFQIRVEPSGHVFDSDEGETILDAALRAGVLLPYGCRDGLCGACRGKVLAGDIDHGSASTVVLSPAEREQGMALFCCATARSALTIEGREARSAAVIPVKTLPVRVWFHRSVQERAQRESYATLIEEKARDGGAEGLDIGHGATLLRGADSRTRG